MNEQEALHTLSIKMPFTNDQLKAAFRKKAFEFHPDVSNGNTEEQMKLVNEAYDQLKQYADMIDNNVHILIKKEPEDDGKFHLWDPCKKCKGEGFVKRDIIGDECPDCQHQGSYPETPNGFLYRFYRYFHFYRSVGYHWATCPRCKGLKTFRGSECVRCAGRGSV